MGNHYSSGCANRFRMSNNSRTSARGALYVVSAPSGTGKTTVVRRLLTKHPELVESISVTTRKPRPGERDGVDYHFVDDDAFDALIRADHFAEWAEVHGNRYGTPQRPIDEAVARGRKVVLDIDVQGGMNLKKRFPDAITVFLLPPSKDALVARLRGRATEDEDQIERRLKNATHEMSFKDRYDHRVINDDVERAVHDLERLMNLT